MITTSYRLKHFILEKEAHNFRRRNKGNFYTKCLNLKNIKIFLFNKQLVDKINIFTKT